VFDVVREKKFSKMMMMMSRGRRAVLDVGVVASQGVLVRHGLRRDRRRRRG
jgi:hypothetical protein